MVSGQAGELETRRRREFRRTLVGSLVIHAGVLGIAMSSPATRVSRPTHAITVELVSLPPSSKAQAAPSPPKPRIRKPKQVVLPAKPSEPKPRPKAKPKPKPEPAKPKRREVVLEPEPKEEKNLEDLLADFRDERGEAQPEPVKTAAAPSPAAAGGAGRQVSPEVLDWVRRTKIHVARAWVVPPGFRTEVLETHVVVKLDGGGNVVGTPTIKRRSGNPWYDEGVIRGIEKASPLPAPPRSGEWDFIFTPEDSY